MSDEADTDGFRLVKNKKRGAPRTPPSESGTVKTPSKIAKTKHDAQQAGPSRPQPPPGVGKARIPSIILDSCVASESFLNEFRKRYSPVYIEAKWRGNKIHVYAEDSQTHRNLSTFAERTQQKYTVYRLEEDKPKKYVIRNIPPYTEEVKVYDALVDLKYSVESVVQMTKNRKTVKLPLYLVTLRKEGNQENIMNMKTLMLYRVRVEPYKPRGILQCYRCQEFGHSSKVCKRDPACLHCAERHDTRSCENKTTNTPRCANCKGKHKAFDRDCPTRVTYAKQYNKRINFNPNQRRKGDKPPPTPNATGKKTPRILKPKTPKTKQDKVMTTGKAVSPGQGKNVTPRTQRQLAFDDFATPLADTPQKEKPNEAKDNLAIAALKVAIEQIKQVNTSITDREIIFELMVLNTSVKEADETQTIQILKDFVIKLTTPA